MTLHDFKGAQDQICPAKQKIDLNSLKSQIFSKMSNINKDYHSNKTEERRTDGPHKRRIS